MPIYVSRAGLHTSCSLSLSVYLSLFLCISVRPSVLLQTSFYMHVCFCLPVLQLPQSILHSYALLASIRLLTNVFPYGKLYILAYIHTYIRNVVYTYIHTYVHTY